MEIDVVRIDKSEEVQLILGHAGFIKSVEDIYEAMINSAPSVRFGVAFAEASGPCLVRGEGNDPGMEALAKKNALAVGAGHTFVVLFTGAYPINVINAIKSVVEVSMVFCATSNPAEVLVVQTDLGRAVIGVVDGNIPKGVEREDGKAERKAFLRQIGYKL